MVDVSPGRINETSTKVNGLHTWSLSLLENADFHLCSFCSQVWSHKNLLLWGCRQARKPPKSPPWWWLLNPGSNCHSQDGNGTHWFILMACTYPPTLGSWEASLSIFVLAGLGTGYPSLYRHRYLFRLVGSNKGVEVSVPPVLLFMVTSLFGWIIAEEFNDIWVPLCETMLHLSGWRQASSCQCVTEQGIHLLHRAHVLVLDL